MITKQQVRKEFEERYKQWMFFDCVIFGEERVEIKIVEVAYRTANLLMMTIPIKCFNDEPELSDLDWSEVSVCPYNAKKRLVKGTIMNWLEKYNEERIKYGISWYRINKMMGVKTNTVYTNPSMKTMEKLHAILIRLTGEDK